LTALHSSNTIVFQSSTADSTSVIISLPSLATAGANHVVKLDGASNIIFRYLTLERTGNQRYASVVELTGATSHNLFSNARLLGVQGIQDESNAAIVFADASGADSSNMFTRCVFRDGASGIFAEGDSLAHDYGLEVSDNEFRNQNRKSIALRFQDSVEINNNIFQSSLTGTQVLFVSDCSGGMRVMKNKAANIQGPCFVFSDIRGDTLNRILLADNFLHSADSCCLLLSGVSGLDAIFNSFNMTSADPEHTVVQTNMNTHDVTLLNDVIMNSGGGMALNIIDDSSSFNFSFDYNDLYTTGTFLCRSNGWRARTFLPGRSSAAWMPIQFPPIPGLQVPVICMLSDFDIDNKGMPVQFPLDDIDGESRSSVTPDIGADEFNALLHDITVSGIVNSCRHIL
jgi:hypothetical protein